jgi:hypothetical protein
LTIEQIKAQIAVVEAIGLSGLDHRSISSR